MATDHPYSPFDPDRPGGESGFDPGVPPYAGGDYGDYGGRNDDTAEYPPSVDEDEIAGLRTGGRPRPVSHRFDDRPSRLVSHYLFATEKFRGEWRKHKIVLVKDAAIAAVATIFFGWLAGLMFRNGNGGLGFVAVLLWLAVLGYTGWHMADWGYERFVLTNKRIMLVKGPIKRSVGMMPLARVTDMKYEQSFLGRMLNYGTFVVESAGQDQALRTVKQMPNPSDLYIRIVEEMYEPEAVEARINAEVGDTADVGDA